MTPNFAFEVQRPDNRELFILCVLMTQYFPRIHLQEKRICDGLHPKNLDNLYILFADIHFYFITVTNIQNLLLRIRQVLPTDQVFSQIFKKYIKHLNMIDSVRDHLEHITDKRINGQDKKGEPLKDPNNFGNLLGDIYNFGGDEINIKDMFSMMSRLEGEFNSWLKGTSI